MFCSLCRWRKISRACSFQSMRPVHNVNHFPGRLCRSTRKLWAWGICESGSQFFAYRYDICYPSHLDNPAKNKKVLYMRQVFSKCEAIRSFQINILHYWASKDLKTAFKMLKVSHIRTELLELQATKVFIQKSQTTLVFSKECFFMQIGLNIMPFHCSLTRRTPSHRYPSV